MGKSKNFICPDGCCEPDTEIPRGFKNVQTLEMHLLHMQGVDGHPQRTIGQIRQAIFNTKVLPPVPKVPGKGGGLNIKK